MRDFKNIFLSTWAVALLSLTGCAPLAPQLDTHFGEAVKLARSQQTANPDAAANLDPVYGMDGVAARETIVRYQKSFKDPEPAPNVFTIGVGGGK